MLKISADGLSEAIKVMLREGAAKVILRVVTTPDNKIGFTGLSELQAEFLEAGEKMEKADEGALKEAKFCCASLRYIEERWGGVPIKGLDVDEILCSIARGLNIVFKDHVLMAERDDDENGPAFAFILGPSAAETKVKLERKEEGKTEKMDDELMTALLRSRASVSGDQLN
jgi:hypothetical protein